MLNGTKRIELAVGTLEIIEKGYYRSSAGHTVNISQQLAASINKTITIKPEYDVQFILETMRSQHFQTEPVVEVTHESTLAAAKRLYELGKTDICCLNFASAKNPGGGFLDGSQAQEESLARSSALYATQTKDMQMYEYNNHRKTMLYSDYMIYSPAVPVFRDDQGELLEEAYTTAFITSPAVNLAALKRNAPHEESLVKETFNRRLEKILAIAYLSGHRTLVLGAWGCGVFANEPAMIASLFNEYLGKDSPYRNCFKHIVYAIYGTDKTYQCFEQQLLG